ncbi:MAG: hypothetical protein VW867_02485, partial [Gammaproteobacteria bacterium]
LSGARLNGLRSPRSPSSGGTTARSPSRGSSRPTPVASVNAVQWDNHTVSWTPASASVIVGASASLVSEAMFFSTGITSGNPAIVPAPGRYTLNTGIAVSDAAAYVSAWQEYIGALDSNSAATNLFVLNGMGDQPATHAVTISANSMAELFPQNPTGQEAYAKLIDDVKDIRSVENRSIYVDLAVFGN